MSALRPAPLRTLVALMALLLLLTACGSDDADTTTTAESETTVETESAAEPESEDASEEEPETETEEEREAEEEAEREGEGAITAVCEGEALADDELGLPDDLPVADGLTLVEAGEQGPSDVADGYFDGELQDAYDAIKEALEESDYTITFDEIERDDAEITYESPDGSSDGIFALRASCGGESPIAVHITNRPA